MTTPLYLPPAMVTQHPIMLRCNTCESPSRFNCMVSDSAAAAESVDSGSSPSANASPPEGAGRLGGSSLTSACSSTSRISFLRSCSGTGDDNAHMRTGGSGHHVRFLTAEFTCHFQSRGRLFKGQEHQSASSSTRKTTRTHWQSMHSTLDTNSICS